MNLSTADSWFSKYIRIRDANQDGIVFCISCGKPVHWTKADNGHFIKRQHKSLRFNEINCNAQCKECNWLKQGNDINYAKGLEKKYAPGIVEKLEFFKKATCHLGQLEIHYLIGRYKALFLELKKQKGL